MNKSRIWQYLCIVAVLVLMALLFASLLSSAMAVRFYNHAGFICAMPVGSEARRRWAPTAVSYLRRAGLHVLELRFHPVQVGIHPVDDLALL